MKTKKNATKSSESILTAAAFMERLKSMASQKDKDGLQRYFKTGKGEYGEGDIFIGVRIGKLTALAKEFSEMPTAELKKLLTNSVHEARSGALTIMDIEARKKKTPEIRKREFFKLYLSQHKNINNWDLVDRAAPSVIGGFLLDKDRKILYDLATSDNMWERRSAIISTLSFVRRGDTKDALQIMKTLLRDKHDLIQKANGTVLRTIGDKNPPVFFQFLDKNVLLMPRTTLRYAIEHLSDAKRQHYLKLKKS